MKAEKFEESRYFKDNPDMRKCLGGCDRMFLSPGRGFRICPKCQKKKGKKQIVGYLPNFHRPASSFKSPPRF